MIKTVRRSIPPLYQQVKLHGHKINFEIDGKANDTLCSKETWIEIVKLKFQPVEASINLQMRTHCKYWDSSKSLHN